MWNFINLAVCVSLSNWNWPVEILIDANWELFCFMIHLVDWRIALGDTFYLLACQDLSPDMRFMFMRSMFIVHPVYVGCKTWTQLKGINMISFYWKYLWILKWQNNIFLPDEFSCSGSSMFQRILPFAYWADYYGSNVRLLQDAGLGNLDQFS